MSASDNLSNELFFTAHRGLYSDKPVGNNLGMHWSADKGIAEHFSRGLGTKPVETVITAKVPMSSVETDTNTLVNKSVLGRTIPNAYAHEQEVPVKSGASVFVESISRRGNVSRKKGDAANEKFLNKIEEGGMENSKAWDMHAESRKHYDRAEKRSRRITTRFNPPKEMQA